MTMTACGGGEVEMTMAVGLFVVMDGGEVEKLKPWTARSHDRLAYFFEDGELGRGLGFNRRNKEAEDE